MKKILQYILMSILFCACAKEKTTIWDFEASVDDISRIELRADHKTLLPNGEAKMEFYPFVYGKKNVMKYGKDEEGEYISEMVEEEYLIPDDQLPKGCVKVYDQAGNEIKENVYSTTTEIPGTVLNFYAKAGAIESNRLPITIRDLPDESYDEIVVPVIFHMLLPPASAGPTYDISQEYMEKVLEGVNNIFNRRITTDPNGGNVKLTFKLAVYDPSGVKLQEAGKNVINLSESNIKYIEDQSTSTASYVTGYDKFIVRYKSTCIWNPERYLNIWLTRFSMYSDEAGTYSYETASPTVMHSDYDIESIPGLSDVQTKDRFTLSDVTSCLEVGVLVNYMTFLNPSVQGTNTFTLATVLAEYYGLLSTNTRYYKNLNSDGDIDYCSDTYTSYANYYPLVFKANNLEGQPEELELEWFTSFNVIDRYSRKNSVSIDQALRMRKVLKQCPSRWAYKSDWAFTGK